NEPSSTTIASESSTSTSEIQTDTSEPSQLEVFVLNYLQNQEISTIPTRILKLNPCSICQRKYIMQAETEPPLTCSSCNIIIELTKEEAVLISGKYHLQKKQTDTGQGNEELITSLGLVEGGSHARQGSQSKQVTMQDQATSPIVIEDDTSENNDNERTPDASNRSANPLRRLPRHSSRQSVTSGNNNHEHNILQGLLQELSTPVRGESIENNEVAEDDSEASMSKTLTRLFQKVYRAETRATKAIQEEISCWYYYEKAYKERVEEIKNARRGISD
ncbi:8994_t:CDS:2, partial [Funneliformis mosseae]